MFDIIAGCILLFLAAVCGIIYWLACRNNRHQKSLAVMAYAAAALVGLGLYFLFLT